MYKLISLTLATAASAAFLAQPLLSQNIIVTPQISHQEFVEKVSQDLNRQLRAAAQMDTVPDGEGISIVRFTRDSEGDAANVKIYRASGKGGFDRIAKRAVNRLRSLDSLPAGAGSDQVYQANVIFAETWWDAEDLEQQLAAEEATRLASSPTERQVFAFGSAGSRPKS